MLWRLAQYLYRSSVTANRLLSRGLLGWQTHRLGQPRSRSAAGYEATVTQEARLPPMAWLCRREGPRFAFVVGSGVETFDRGFFEGAWAGEFDRFDEIAPCLHFGSGALFENAGIRFFPPKHPLEQLFLFRDKRRGVDHISNSLCGCLAASGAERGSVAFERIAATIVESTHVATRQGVYRYDPVVAEDCDFAFLRVFHNNFSVRPEGRIRFAQPYLGREFRDFRDYRGFLSSRVASLFRNALHPARRRPLPPIVSVSSGYDSPAVAVLAREHGCGEAVTIAVNVGGVEDSGREIAERLGLAVREFPHLAGRELDRLPMTLEGQLVERAREFIATAGVGDDLTFAAFEPALRGRLLLTGAWGDSIWTKGSNVPPGLPVRIRFGKSLTEYRLRLGFAHVPVPFIGGLLPRSIAAISDSAEMAQYSVGGSYDRPIPRRIVEEAGIARRGFGLSKVATAPDPLNQAALWSEAVEHVMRRYSTVSSPQGAP
jgi:hypothetical protein